MILIIRERFIHGKTRRQEKQSSFNKVRICKNEILLSSLRFRDCNLILKKKLIIRIHDFSHTLKMELFYNREIMLTLNFRNLNVTNINSKFINDNYKNTLGQFLLYTVKQIDVICQYLQQRPLCLTKQNNNSNNIIFVVFVCMC